MMDDLDRLILNEIQSDFPLTDRPYLTVGEKLGIGEDEVVRRVQSLKKSGIIRRIGANFDSRKIGFTSTLCAARVPGEKLEEFVAKVNSYPGVTHNYLRQHAMNVWFTLIAPSEERIGEVLAEIEEATGVRGIMNLPAEKMYKIQVDFNVVEE
jgi:DNA-binding Lrp family transcriptional regulator